MQLAHTCTIAQWMFCCCNGHASPHYDNPFRCDSPASRIYDKYSPTRYLFLRRATTCHSHRSPIHQLRTLQTWGTAHESTQCGLPGSHIVATGMIREKSTKTTCAKQHGIYRGACTMCCYVISGEMLRRCIRQRCTAKCDIIYSSVSDIRYTICDMRFAIPGTPYYL